MALTGSQQAYLQARSGIARSAAIRSNYIFPLFGVIRINGVDFTQYVLHGSLRVTQAINEEPDTCSFELRVYNSLDVAVGRDVLIGLGGATDNALFGGRILSTQVRRMPARTANRISVLCADYLQVLDSEYLITYNWGAQSATTTILDLVARFVNKTGAPVISTAGVQLLLPTHGPIAVTNERISTVLRRITTAFPAGGGFYVDPLKVLHVWSGASEPGVVNPTALTIDLETLKGFTETVDSSQLRDAVIVEGARTSAPLGSPGQDLVYDPTGRGIRSLPVLDASIFKNGIDAGFDRYLRIGSQRLKLFGGPDGAWSSPAGTPQVSTVTQDVPFNPDPAVTGGQVAIPIADASMLSGRSNPWIKIDDQYLKVLGWQPISPPYVFVPRAGFGAMLGPIKSGAAVTAIDSLSALMTTQRYDVAGNQERVRAQPIDSDVVLAAQVFGVGNANLEHLVQDGRYSHAGAVKRGQQEIADFKDPIKAIDWETEDLNARPGRLQAYSFDSGAMAGELMILSVELSWPVWGKPPRAQCHAAKVLTAAVIDTWLTDER